MNFRLTPDGQRYLRMAQGHREPIPFDLRWLLPWLCGESKRRWVAVNVMSIAAAALLTAGLALQHGATPIGAVVAMLLLAGLPWIRFCWFAPVLNDMPALALSLGAAVLWPVEPLAAIPVALLAGAVSEKAPIWAAIFAFSPWLLIGLASPVMRRLLVTPGQVSPSDPLGWTMRNPLEAGRRGHAGRWRDPRLMLLPWGATLAVLAFPTLWVGVALLAGYSQLLVATDSVRLYQQAAPVLCVSAALLIPVDWALPVLVAHWLNPFAGEGL